MIKTAPPLSEFDDLRRQAIGYAQDASRDHWSDYNFHDPGVTLLEQTCFALSQLSYQSALPIRDLLTTSHHSFLFHDIGMIHPLDVLNSQPVTDTDITAWIAQCDDIESIILTPRGASYPGQYDITVFAAYDTTLTADDLKDTAREVFGRRRALCTTLHDVNIAQRVDVKLAGQIEIAPGIAPETVAAHVYLTVHDILSGLDKAIETQIGATRAAVYDAPERLLNPNRRVNTPSLSLANQMSAVRNLPGILEIDSLDLCILDLKKAVPKTAHYFHCVMPETSDHLKYINFTLDGAPLALDPSHIREEYARIHAERVGQTHHHINAADWDVMKPGRPRLTTQSHVDSLLPIIFRATGYEPGETDTTIGQYRHAINAVLQDINTALARLPETFHSDHKADLSDPVEHRQRIALLDYLIAHQGIEMPSSLNTGIHCYRCTTSMHRFEIQWRLTALDVLPRAQAGRGIGPNTDHSEPGGFLSMMALMCDLDLVLNQSDGDIDAPSLSSYGVTVVHSAPLTDQPSQTRIVAIRTDDLLDLVPIAVPDADPFDAGHLAGYSPFIADNTITPALLRKLADPDCFFILPITDDQWQVVANLGDGSDLWHITAFDRDPDLANDPRDEARLCAARLRATWLMLNRSAECLHLIEPVLSAGNGPYPAYTADLVLPDWTARCALDSYRTYVQSQLDAHAPAHLVIKLHWLSITQTAQFEALLNDNASSMDLHAFLARTDMALQ